MSEPWKRVDRSYEEAVGSGSQQSSRPPSRASTSSTVSAAYHPNLDSSQFADFEQTSPLQQQSRPYYGRSTSSTSSFSGMDFEFTNSARLQQSAAADKSAIFDFDSTTNRTFAAGEEVAGYAAAAASSSNRQPIGIVTPRPSTARIAGTECTSTKHDASKSNLLTIINLLTEHVLSHPFAVIRRQAQINNRSDAYHLTPFTVLPFMFGIQASQGVAAFFKGLPSSLINHVLLIGTESLCYNLLQFPIEYDFAISQLFSERFVKHLALKALSILLVTPFVCAGSVEMVQSLIVTESPSPLDCFREGFSRILHFRSDRKLPIYRLIGPSIAYHLAYYVIYNLTRESLLYLHRRAAAEEQELRRLRGDNEESASGGGGNHHNTLRADTQNILNELKCSLYANIITDAVLYPFQTVLYRLFLQGTRTLIDNVDGRTAVIPLISNYESASDCYQSIVRYEGTAGLFKGFGALVLQYSVQASLIHLTNYCLNTIFSSY